MSIVHSVLTMPTDSINYESISPQQVSVPVSPSFDLQPTSSSNLSTTSFVSNIYGNTSVSIKTNNFVCHFILPNVLKSFSETVYVNITATSKTSINIPFLSTSLLDENVLTKLTDIIKVVFLYNVNSSTAVTFYCKSISKPHNSIVVYLAPIENFQPMLQSPLSY